jgi:hypothetical protein
MIGHRLWLHQVATRYGVVGLQKDDDDGRITGGSSTGTGTTPSGVGGTSSSSGISSGSSTIVVLAKVSLAFPTVVLMP